MHVYQNLSCECGCWNLQIDIDIWMAEVQNQQSRECKHKGEKELWINVQPFWFRWVPESFPRQLLGKNSRLLRVPLSRQILGGEAAFGVACTSWTPLSPVSGFKKKSIYKQKSFLSLPLSNTGITGVWMQFYFSFLLHSSKPTFGTLQRLS